MTDHAITDRTVAIAPADISQRDLNLVFATLAWSAAGAITLLWPNIRDFALTTHLAAGQWLIGAALLLAYGLGARLRGVERWLRKNGPWLIALPVLLSIWQIASAKTGYWPLPYFPPAQDLLGAYASDYPRLLEGIRASLVLLSLGIAFGAIAGFLTGLATGWTRRVGYWTSPILRFIGPIPTTALIPLVLFLFPSSFSAGVFLVALATWFPVTILTWSGVAAVDKAYYDVARTLGARPGFLILRVAVPAALPHVFVGLFMALGSAFSVLMVAELVGVKAGIGFYMQWAQGWASYANVYAALVVLALLCSGSITLLFRLRDLVLSWQKGLVQW